MLTDAELTSLRSEAVSWMPFTCDIYRSTGADDAFGGRSSSHGAEGTEIAADVPCSLESGAAQEQVQILIGQLRDLQLFTVYVPAETDVQVGDHVVVHTPDHPNLHLNVLAEMAPESYEVERRIIGAEIGIATHA